MGASGAERRVADARAGSSLARSGHAAPKAETIDFGLGPVKGVAHVNPDGSIGGWVAFSANVHEDCFVGPNCFVMGNARVFDGSRIEGEAVILDNAKIHNSIVGGDAMVGGVSTVVDARVDGDARITERAHVAGGAHVTDQAKVGEDARILGPARIDERASVRGRAWVSGGHITGRAIVDGNAAVRPGALIDSESHFSSGVFDGLQPSARRPQLEEEPAIPEPDASSHAGSDADDIGGADDDGDVNVGRIA